MKILICTKLDLTSCVAINELLSQLREGGHEWWVVLSDKVNEGERGVPSQFDLAFYERDNFLLWSESRRDSQGQYLPFHLLYTRYDTHVETLKDVNTDTRFLHRLAKWGPDVILSIRYNYIFRQPLIDLAKKTVLNLHPGKLPEYAGFFAPFWSIKQGEPFLTCTLHSIENEQLDSGDVVGEARMEVEPDRSVMWHFTELYRQGIPVLAGVLRNLHSHINVVAKVQNLDQRQLFSHPAVSDMKEFERGGGRMVLHEDYLEWCRRFLEP